MAGPDVQELFHKPGVDGHTEGRFDVLGCERCADNMAAVLRELGVGQTGHGLQYRDVFVLAGYHCPAPRDEDFFVKRLRQHHRMPVRVVEVAFNDDGMMTKPPTADDARELAMAEDDNIIVTDWRAVRGLERRAVFVVGGRGKSDLTQDHVAWTRTTSFLCHITLPGDD